MTFCLTLQALLLIIVSCVAAFDNITAVPVTPIYPFSGPAASTRSGSVSGPYLTLTNSDNGGTWLILKRGPTAYTQIFSRRNYTQAATNGYWFVGSKVGTLSFFRFGNNNTPLEWRDVSIPINNAPEYLYMNRDNTTLFAFRSPSAIYLYNFNTGSFSLLATGIWNIDLGENIVVCQEGSGYSYRVLMPDSQGAWSQVATLDIPAPLVESHSYNGIDTIVSGRYADGKLIVHTRNDSGDWILTNIINFPEVLGTASLFTYFGKVVEFITPTSFLVSAMGYNERTGIVIRYDQNGADWEPMAFITGEDTTRMFGANIVTEMNTDTVLFQLNVNSNPGNFIYEALRPMCYRNTPRVTCVALTFDNCDAVTVTSAELYHHNDTECGPLAVITPALPATWTVQLNGQLQIPFTFQRLSTTSCTATLSCLVPPSAPPSSPAPLSVPSEVAPSTVPSLAVVASPIDTSPSPSSVEAAVSSAVKHSLALSVLLISLLLEYGYIYTYL